MTKVQPHRTVLVGKQPADTPDAICVCVIFVKAQLIRDVQSDEQAAGDADRQTEEIYKAEALVPEEVSEGDFEIVAKHDFADV
jgi:hypothetical protein